MLYLYNMLYKTGINIFYLKFNCRMGLNRKISRTMGVINQTARIMDVKNC